MASPFGETDFLIICGFVLVYFAVFYLYKAFHRPGALPVSISEKTANAQSQDEAEGTLPDPKPFYDFDLATARTRNYVYANKCIRFPYFQTMSHQPLDVDNWIEIDKDYAWYIQEKERIIAQEGKRAVDSLPENDEACNELLATVVDYLPKVLAQSLTCFGATDGLQSAFPHFSMHYLTEYTTKSQASDTTIAHSSGASKLSKS